MHKTGTSGLEIQSCKTGKALQVSAIIPTKNRHADLRHTLDSLVVQTHRPDEIIVVDQSASPASELPDFGIAITYVYAPQVSGAAVARNVAMERATGDIWLFLDDDVILEPEYIEEILIAYSPGFAGVSGIITNYRRPGFWPRLFENVFARGPFHDHRQPIYWHADELRDHGPQRVNQFTGAVMSFRADVVGNLRFDLGLTGGSLAEDIDFCARLPRGAVLVIAPKARLFHKRSEIGRPTAHWLQAHAQSSSYMRARNWNRGWKDDFCFAWLQIGYALMAGIGAVKRVSLEPFRAWKTGAARGHGLGARNTRTPSCAYKLRRRLEDSFR